MVEFQNTGKSYGSLQVIENLNLRVAQGEFLVLIGPSGSGKSTLLKMINRMEDHDAGKILFEGSEIYSQSERKLRLRMGYAIQSVGLFPHWTVARNIATVPQMLGWPKEKIHRRVDELLELFQLDPAVFKTRYPHQLSGGQQQRIGVARALAADPAILLMDEPFGALDPATRAALQVEIKRIHRASGKTIVLVTHDIDEALFLATRIVLLNHGRIEQAATPFELLARPASAFVTDFAGRSDIGIKLLSLQPVSSLLKARTPIASPSAVLPSVAFDATLREAVSVMAAAGTSAVQVLQPISGIAGVVQAADLFESVRHG